MEINRGEFKVIKVDGTEVMFSEKPSISKIQREIGCECCDSVTLDRKKGIIMMCDDTGMLDRKPVNEKATALARKAFGQQYPYSIHGNVAIVNGEDFA